MASYIEAFLQQKNVKEINMKERGVNLVIIHPDTGAVTL